MSETPTIVAIYAKWTSTGAISEFISHLQMQYPDASDLDIANHALHFSQAHMMAYLVSALDDAAPDPDKPSWM